MRRDGSFAKVQIFVFLNTDEADVIPRAMYFYVFSTDQWHFC